MGARRDREEPHSEGAPEQTEPVPASGQTQIVEVPINLELLNNKINYLITSMDRVKKELEKK